MNSIVRNDKHSAYIQGMDAYIKQLKKLPADQAKEVSRKSLIRSGVLTKNGHLKEIVK